MAAATEKQKANMRAWHAANRDRHLASMRTGYLKNRPARDAQTLAWKRAHPEIRKAIRFADNANQRARRRGLPGRLRSGELLLLVGPCAYCAGAADSYDHVHPLHAGGPNAIENIVPSCLPCNWHKGRRIPEPAEVAEILLRDRTIRTLTALAH